MSKITNYSYCYGNNCLRTIYISIKGFSHYWQHKNIYQINPNVDNIKFCIFLKDIFFCLKYSQRVPNICISDTKNIT